MQRPEKQGEQLATTQKTHIIYSLDLQSFPTGLLIYRRIAYLGIVSWVIVIYLLGGWSFYTSVLHDNNFRSSMAENNLLPRAAYEVVAITDYPIYTYQEWSCTLMLGPCSNGTFRNHKVLSKYMCTCALILTTSLINPNINPNLTNQIRALKCTVVHCKNF